MSKPNINAVPWPKIQSVPRYTSGPHRWAIVPIWDGATVHTWVCLACGANAASDMDIRANCPEWSSRTYLS